MNSPKLSQGRYKDILQALEHLHHYHHENVKFHVTQSYNQIVLGMMRLAGVLDEDDKFKWQKGHPSQSPLPAEVMSLLDQIVFPYYYSLFDGEDNKEVIERSLSNMIELTDDFGPGVFTNQMDRITDYLIKFLQKKTFCQAGVTEMTGEEEEFKDDEENPEDESGDEQDDADDGIDHDELILGCVTDMMFTCARSFGNEYAPYFNKIAPYLVEYTSDKHPKSDKNMALGCLSEVFAASPGLIPTYFNDYLVLLEKNSHTKDSKVNRNIAYSIGILSQHASLLFQPHVPNAFVLLNKLH